MLFNVLPDKMMMYINMFSTWMRDKVVDKSNTALVVSENDCSCCKWEIQLSKEYAQPHSFFDRVCRGNVFGFYRGSDHSKLFF